jgi:hypothetical protein
MRSHTTAVQRVPPDSFPKTDIDFWVKYGTWSMCTSCGCYHFNDEYFRQVVYQKQRAAQAKEFHTQYYRSSPSEPLEHCEGALGHSSRWWYLVRMYHPAAPCMRCTLPIIRDGERVSVDVGASVRRSQNLYKVPRVAPPGGIPLHWAREVVTWPRYEAGEFVFGGVGDCLLELSVEETRSLSIINLRTQVEKESYGAAHHFNYKKVGLSRAWFGKQLVKEEALPTERAKAAYRFLMQQNKFYRQFWELHAARLETSASLHITSYDLFIVFVGVEAAIFPVLYPTTEFSDTGSRIQDWEYSSLHTDKHNEEIIRSDVQGCTCLQTCCMQLPKLTIKLVLLHEKAIRSLGTFGGQGLLLHELFPKPRPAETNLLVIEMVSRPIRFFLHLRPQIDNT